MNQHQVAAKIKSFIDAYRVAMSSERAQVVTGESRLIVSKMNLNSYEQGIVEAYVNDLDESLKSSDATRLKKAQKAEQLKVANDEFESKKVTPPPTGVRPSQPSQPRAASSMAIFTGPNITLFLQRKLFNDSATAEWEDTQVAVAAGTAVAGPSAATPVPPSNPFDTGGSALQMAIAANAELENKRAKIAADNQQAMITAIMSTRVRGGAESFSHVRALTTSDLVSIAKAHGDKMKSVPAALLAGQITGEDFADNNYTETDIVEAGTGDNPCKVGEAKRFLTALKKLAADHSA